MRVWTFKPYQYKRYGRIDPKCHYFVHSLLTQAINQGQSETRQDRKNAEALQDLLEADGFLIREQRQINNPNAGQPGEPPLVEEESTYLNPEGGEIILEDALHDLGKRCVDAFDKKVLLGMSRQMNTLFDFLEDAPTFDANKQEWKDGKVVDKPKKDEDTAEAPAKK